MERRDFLKTSGALALGSGLLVGCGSAGRPEKDGLSELTESMI